MSPRPTSRLLSVVRKLPVAVLFIVVGYLVLVPFVILVVTSFRPAGTLPLVRGLPWTVQNYLDVVRDSNLGHLLVNTVIVSASSMAIAMLLSLTLAWLVERTDLPLPNVAFVLVVAAMGLPGFVSGIAWVILANPSNGILNEALRSSFGLSGPGPLNVLSMFGMILVQALAFTPATFLLVAAAFRSQDTTVEEAASVAGAGRWRILRRITLPLVAPAVLGAAIYMAVTVIESFDIPLAIGLRAHVPLLSTEVYRDLTPAAGLPNYQFASIHGIALLVLAALPLVFYGRLLGRAEQFATISGQGLRRDRISLGLLRVPATVFVAAVVTLLLILPILVTVWTSVQRYYSVPSAESLRRSNLRAYATIAAEPLFRTALVNTGILVVVGGGLALLLSLLVSWVVVRSRARGRRTLDTLAFLPHVLPAPVLAVSLMVLYLRSALPIYGTLWILVIAIATRYLGLSTRLMNAGLTSMHRELEEAASVSGASWFRTMRRIVLPLLLPSMGNAFLVVAVLGIQQLSMPLILASSSNTVLAPLVWGQWTSGDTGSAMALATVVLVITVAVSVVSRRLVTTRNP